MDENQNEDIKNEKPNEDINKKDKRWWDNLGKLVALILMVVYALWIVNNLWTFIPAGSVILTILTNIMFYGPMVLIMIVTFEYFADKNILIRIAVIAIWAMIFILSFFPEFINLLRK